MKSLVFPKWVVRAKDIAFEDWSSILDLERQRRSRFILEEEERAVRVALKEKFRTTLRGEEAEIMVGVYLEVWRTEGWVRGLVEEDGEEGIGKALEFLTADTPIELGLIYEHLGRRLPKFGRRDYKGLVVLGSSEYVDEEMVIEIKTTQNVRGFSEEDLEKARRQLLLYLWLFGRERGELLLANFNKQDSHLPVLKRFRLEETVSVPANTEEVHAILDGVISTLRKEGICLE